MKTIKLEAIVLGDRQRRHIDQRAIKDLADSIAEKGLFHAIVCVEISGGLKLVAGERRLRAIKSLSDSNTLYSHDGTLVVPGEIPFILIDEDLDAIQLREAELEENIIRVDLSWQEKVAALDELHELRLARDPKHSVAATAREIVERAGDQYGSSIRQTQREIDQARLVAGHLDSPEVAHAKSLTQAASIVSKSLEAELNLKLVERGKHTDVRHTLILGDFNNPKTYIGLPTDFSCIIADPPYGIGANSFGDAAQRVHTYADTEEIAIALAEVIFAAGFEFTLPEAHLYMFCDIEHFITLRSAATSLGWTPWRTPLFWHKTSTSAHAPILNRGFRRSYELILFATKGDKPFSQVYSDVLPASSPRDKDVAAQKPTELYETILGRSCLPGDKVLDPCCGSGTIFKAAESLRLEAWGVEKDKGAYAIAQLTLSSLGGDEDE